MVTKPPAEAEEDNKVEDPTLRRLVFALVSVSVLFVFFGVIYLLLAVTVSSGALSALGIAAIVVSCILLFSVLRKFVRFVPR